MADFCHLHTHTSYSLLDGAARIDRLIDRAVDLEMPALAISDHGNLYGVPEFYFAAKKQGISPVIGCEFYMAESSMDDRSSPKRYHQILWATNDEGYRNLCHLSSDSFSKGFYYKPRIDFDLLTKYSKGLVATTCCLQSHILQLILGNEEEKAEALLKKYLDVFGENFYIEIQNHNLEDQKRCNATLLKWSAKYDIRIVATNDVHYVREADNEAQDVLLCLQTGKDLEDPSRMRFTGTQYYLKSYEEMADAMAFLPDDKRQEALRTTMEIAEKCKFDLETGQLLLPHYPLPSKYEGNMDQYLRDVVFERARKRYPDFNPDVESRLNTELGIIKQTGYAGYFLIVEDFTTAARKMNVSVGPARGSAAGSAVAYCLGITNIDPLEYGLLFERFLNPERISMPDIDIDFDDRGRGRIIDYVVQQYGRDNVCQIITFGTMGAKTAIRDVGRVLGVPLSETDRISKLIPNGPAVSLDSAMKASHQLRALKDDPDPKIQSLLRHAQVLEGTARHTSIHAAGIIIAPGRVQDYIPVAKAKSRENKDEDALISQYDGGWVEKFGLLKMDMLGLATLTILDDACSLIKKNRHETLDLYSIPLDDEKTFHMFQRGDTTGLFQFDSSGMRRWLTELRPTNLNDLIAMNALFRPGPMDLIPSYIKRAHGEEEVTYPHPILEPVLAPTYGIPVYQEQVMQMAQVMGGYTLGGADILRRAMGKKKAEEMARQRAFFVSGAEQQGIDTQSANDTFDMMAKFAGYGFNKSHSAAYSLLAYQTAYLKANYMPEYIAAVMSHPNTSPVVVNMLRAEAQRHNIKLLPPSILHSEGTFTVEDGNIRFGLFAVKGVQRMALESLIDSRSNQNRPKTLHAVLKDLDLKKINEKTLVNLTRVGALDDIEGHRAQIIQALKPAISHERKRQEDESAGQLGLFDAFDGDTQETDPPLPVVERWDSTRRFTEERELTGIYITGHPLDEFKVEYRSLITHEMGDESLTEPDHKELHAKRHVIFCGVITEKKERRTRANKRIVTATLEDYSGSASVIVFSRDLEKFEPIIKKGHIALVKGELQHRGGMIEVLPKNILLMSDIRKNGLKSLRVRINAHSITRKKVTEFKRLCVRNRGRCPVVVQLQDRQVPEGYLRLQSALKVRPSSDFFASLEGIFSTSAISVESRSMR